MDQQAQHTPGLPEVVGDTTEHDTPCLARRFDENGIEHFMVYRGRIVHDDVFPTICATISEESYLGIHRALSQRDRLAAALRECRDLLYASADHTTEPGSYGCDCWDACKRADAALSSLSEVGK